MLRSFTVVVATRCRLTRHDLKYEELENSRRSIATNGFRRQKFSAVKLLPCAFGPSLTLEEARSLKINFSAVSALPEKTSAIELDHPGPLDSCRTEFLFAYDIFPTYLLRAETQWRRERRGMRVGDIIVQRAVLPPIGFGLCIDFAVRISTIYNTIGRLGFAYQTLTGHLERGTSEFYFEERGGRIFFVIRTYSEPSHWWLAQMGGGLFALVYQAWCTRQALKQVKERFRRENLNISG